MMNANFAIRHDPIYWYPARNGNKTDPLNLGMNNKWAKNPVRACEEIGQKCSDLGIRRVQINHPDGDMPYTSHRQPNEYQRLKHRDPQRLKKISEGFSLLKEVIDELSIYAGPGYVPISQQKYMTDQYFLIDARDPKNVKKLCDQYSPWIDMGVDRIVLDNISGASCGPAGTETLVDSMQKYLNVPIYSEALPYGKQLWKEPNQELFLLSDKIDGERLPPNQIEDVFKTVKHSFIVFETYIDRVFAKENGPSESFSPRIGEDRAEVIRRNINKGQIEVVLLLKPLNTISDANENKMGSIYEYYRDDNGKVVPIPDELKNPILGFLGDLRSGSHFQDNVRDMIFNFAESGHTFASHNWDLCSLAAEAFNASRWNS